MTFGLGPELDRVVAPARTLVLVPPGVVHSFDNDSSAETRFLNVHAPSGGFVESLRGRSAFDSHDPPADGGRPASNAVVRRPGEGEALSVGQSTLTVKARADDGDGSFSLAELTLAPGFSGPAPHVHQRHLDSFYVLEGTLAITLGDDVVEAPAGTFAVAPPGTVHAFANPGGTARALNIAAPGGFERYLREVVAADTADPSVLAEIAGRHDFTPARPHGAT